MSNLIFYFFSSFSVFSSSIFFPNLFTLFVVVLSKSSSKILKDFICLKFGNFAFTFFTISDTTFLTSSFVGILFPKNSFIASIFGKILALTSTSSFPSFYPITKDSSIKSLSFNIVSISSG